MGEEVAKAERMVRAKVDSLVAGKVEPVSGRSPRCEAEANSGSGWSGSGLDDVEQQLRRS